MINGDMDRKMVKENPGKYPGLVFVPKKGLEPPRPYEHMSLKHACLPISPLRHEMDCEINDFYGTMDGLFRKDATEKPSQSANKSMRPKKIRFIVC